MRVFQDGVLTSSGDYAGKAGLAGAHMGLYTNRLMKRATVFNDDIEIRVGSSALPAALEKLGEKK